VSRRGHRKRRLPVIEPNLKNPSGHHAEFVRALGMRAEGWQSTYLPALMLKNC